MAILSKTFVNSTNLDHGKYDETNQTLTIAFKNGGLYEYSDVPPSIWEDLTTASSAGSFFAQQIKGVFDYARVG